MLRSVDLPEPDGPVTATDSPAGTRRVTSTSAATCVAPRGYTFATCWRRTAAGRSSAPGVTERPGTATPDEAQHLLDGRARAAAAVHDHVGAQHGDERIVRAHGDVHHAQVHRHVERALERSQEHRALPGGEV